MKIKVIRSRRKTMAMQIRPDGSVLVRVPRFMPQWVIRSFVESRRQAASWKIGE